MDPTIEFNLLTFGALRTASFSTARIERGRLRDRILLARTSRGNFAKLQVHAGDDLLISRLTVYNSHGCIVKTAANLTIRASFSCDLDEARETHLGSDFWWEGVSPGVSYLVPTNGAAFYEYPDIDDCDFDMVRSAPFERRRIERTALRDQMLFCRTSQGRYAKFLVLAGDTLKISRLVVYDTNGNIHLEKSNIDVPRTYTIDLDSGEVAANGYDLWWEAVTNTEFYLTPANGAEISFASYFSFEKYLALLRNSGIRSALIFQDASGSLPYDHWDISRKLHLREWIYAREVGNTRPLWGPPRLTSDRYMSDCDAWKIYLAHVTQSLWIEANHHVSWRLDTTDSEYLEYLFDSRKLMSYSSHGHAFDAFTMGAVTDWNPEFSYEFLSAQNLIGSDHWETIQRLTEWIRGHFQHISGYRTDPEGGPFATQADQFEYIYGYRGLPLVDRMIQPLPGRRHITDGCWGTDGFFAAVLRAVNIPVRHGRSNFSGAIHSRPEFFTVGQNLAHGDDPYNGWIRLGHNNAPIDRVFLNNTEIRELIDSPTPRPGMTSPETASFNHLKHLVTLGVQYKTDWILRLRCQDMASGETPPRSRLWQSLHDYYSDTEINQIATDCDTAIAAIPGGCDSL